MMEQKPALQILLAGLLLLAGCSSSVSDLRETGQQQTARSSENISESRIESDATAESISAAEQRILHRELSQENRSAVQAAMSDFFARLPENRTERRQEIIKIARATCTDPRLGPINSTTLNATTDATRRLRELKYATEIINENYNRNYNPQHVERAVSIGGDLAKYAPAVSSYNRFYAASCEVHRNPSSQSIKNFSLASAALGMELILIQQQVFYKTSFAVTRTALHKLPLMKVRAYCGNRCLALLLSEIHWVVRGQLYDADRYIVDTLETNNLKTSRVPTNRTVLQAGLSNRVSGIRAPSVNLSGNRGSVVKQSVAVRNLSEKLASAGTEEVRECYEQTADNGGGSDSGLLGDATDLAEGLREKVSKSMDDGDITTGEANELLESASKTTRSELDECLSD